MLPWARANSGRHGPRGSVHGISRGFIRGFAENERRFVRLRAPSARVGTRHGHRSGDICGLSSMRHGAIVGDGSASDKRTESAWQTAEGKWTPATLDDVKTA